MRKLSYTVVFCALLSIRAFAQTKVPAGASPKRAAPNAATAVPFVKCVDQDTAAACKSFKELVGARDQRLLKAILGNQENAHRHIAYVCFRPQTDAFSVIEFEFPEKKDYRQPYTLNDEMARSAADDSLPTNRAVRELAERNKKLLEDSIFGDYSNLPAVSQYTKDQWFQDHSKDFVYSLGFVADYLYQDGLYKGAVIDQGEWSILAGNKSGIQHDSPTSFIGSYAWIERFNLQHGDVSANDDDREHGHISADPSSIHVHYSFENPSGSMVDYTVQINRLTGRFVEFFRFPDGNESDKAAGRCMIFK